VIEYAFFHICLTDWEPWVIEEWEKTNWALYGMRFEISTHWLELSNDDPWQYIYARFWSYQQASQLVYGPLHVKEISYEQWEIDGRYVNPSMKRFEIRHWGRK
jgi:hypothetical protein